jgi:hypothetical protein
MTGFADVFETPPVDFNRGRYKRPLVMQLDGTEIEYLRPSQIGSHAKDSEGLIRWSTRRAARATASATGWSRGRIITEDDPVVLDQLINDAIRQAATEPDAADRGTSFHDAVQAGTSADRTERAGLDSRSRVLASAGLVEVPEYRERLVVSDRFRTAGRWDGLVMCPEGLEVEFRSRHCSPIVWDLSNRLVVMDDKTGRNACKFGKRGGVSGGEQTAMQLTAYANSDLYDPATGVRTRVEGLSKVVGLIVHTDLDTHHTRLVWTLLNGSALEACCTLANWKPSLTIGGDSCSI